ncbi:hypothetical protein ACM46_14310 [Chryseobacterium angstadtii]|uniref:Uncharacterized protein n=2 Tax=Chryseobacterium angstadtii TaxID=558151 RepID=A0A0J7I9P7_9FLAO|nr:hypothetical protein ACM46_14310 [Chryseobacterium angstadtii]
MFDHQNIILFPAFIPNVKDSLYLFNDTGMHHSCMEKHSLGSKVSAFLDKMIFKTRPENRICDIGGNIIDLPENYLFISLLTSDETDKLYTFNMMNIDIRNISIWPELQDFIAAAERFLEKEKWESIGSFNELEYVLEKIKSCP